MKPRQATFLILAVASFVLLNVSTATYLWLYIKREHYLAAISAGKGTLNVLDYGAVCDGVSDDTNAFNEALQDAHQHGTAVYVPGRTCQIDGTIRLQMGTVIRSDGAILIHGRNSGALLNAVSVDDWVIEGPLTLIGSRVNQGQVGDETGLLISGANRFIVDKLTVRNFTGTGVELSGGKPSRAALGDRGKFAFLSIIDNHLGLSILDGTKYSAEYNLFTLMSLSGNDTAIKIVAGNNIISTSNIVNNNNGILLTDGLNHGHGIMNAVNINHNKGFNLNVQHVTNGFTFNGCHIYGDSETSGTVTLNDSKDINFFGCTLFPVAIAK